MPAQELLSKMIQGGGNKERIQDGKTPPWIRYD